MVHFKKVNIKKKIFSQFSSLIRKGSNWKLIQDINNNNNSGTDSNIVIITGKPGVGESTLLSQLQVYAIESNHLIVNVPYHELFLNDKNDFF